MIGDDRDRGVPYSGAVSYPSGQLISAMQTDKYEIIYCDPAWKYRDKANAGKRGACHKYGVMTLNEICALPVADSVSS